MKKALAAAAALAALLMLASCSDKDDNGGTTLTPEQAIAANTTEAKTTEDLSSIAAERDVLEDEIGKTIPDKKLVVCLTKSNWYEYEVIMFDKDGLAEYKLTYFFYNTREDYENALDYKKDGFKDIQEKNKELMMIVDKNKKYYPSPYEVCYNTAKELEDETHIIIE